MPSEKQEQGKPSIPEFYDLKDVADAMGVHPNYLYNEVNRGHLIAYKIGKTYKVLRKDYETYLETKKIKPDGTASSDDEE